MAKDDRQASAEEPAAEEQPEEEVPATEAPADGEEASETGEDRPESEDAEEDSETEGEESEDGAEEAAPDNGLPLTLIVEALLFAAREPLKAVQIARAVGKRTRQDAVRQAIDELNVQYLESSRAFEIAEISGRYQLMSRPEFADYIMRIYPKKELEENKAQRLTPAMLDTLAIIAYKQPVMRSDIDHIRGVSCANALRALVERGSVREVGRRADLVGKPAVFGTTERFLAEFGLGSLDELPMRHEFVEPGGPPPVELTVADDQPAAEADEADAVPVDGEDAPDGIGEENIDEKNSEDDDVL